MDLAQAIAARSRGQTYGRLRFAGGRWVLSDAPPHVAIKLKALFPSIPKTQVGAFEFKHTPAICTDLEWFIDRYPMAINVEDARLLIKGRLDFETGQDELATILKEGWKPSVPLDFKPGKALYDYQAQAVEVIAQKRCLLLMDDLGLGKTVTALGALLRTKALPAAIVVQPHLTTQWLKKFIQPFTHLRAHVIQGTQPYKLPPADIYIFRYTNIAGWVDIASTGIFKAVIFDEMQELRRGGEAAKGRAARVFCENAEIRVGLTATPVFNYGSEMFHIVDLLSPGFLGSYEDFTREWCRWTGAKYVVKDPDALGAYLQSMHITLRRERSGRPVNTITVEVDYDEEVEKEASALTRMLAQKVLTGSFVERGQAARELDIHTRMLTGIGKAHSVAAYVRMILKGGGGPVILAGWHREVYQIWLDELAEFRPVMHTGTETATQKEKAVEAFCRGETDLFIISLRSGAGIDGLQHRCSTVVVGELDWSPKVHEQLVGRIDRPGQSKEVTAIYLHTDWGSDPLVLSVLGVKSSQARGITNPMAGVEQVFTDESRIRLLAERFLQQEQAK